MAEEYLLFTAIGTIVAIFGAIFMIINYRYRVTQDKESEQNKMMESIKEDLRDYIDKGDLDVKRELAYAIKLVCKDITFLQQFAFGKESKSIPAYITGEEETKEHDEREGEGMFRDTQQERRDRNRSRLQKEEDLE